MGECGKVASFDPLTEIKRRRTKISSFLGQPGGFLKELARILTLEEGTLHLLEGIVEGVGPRLPFQCRENVSNDIRGRIAVSILKAGPEIEDLDTELEGGLSQRLVAGLIAQPASRAPPSILCYIRFASKRSCEVSGHQSWR